MRLTGERALEWAVAMFGEVALCREERSARFIEEAVEAVHAIGLSAEVLHAVVDRVYSRGRGDISRELGQAQLTLDTLGAVLGVCPAREADAELQRVQAIPRDEWNRRHEAKVAAGIANVAALASSAPPSAIVPKLPAALENIKKALKEALDERLQQQHEYEKDARKWEAQGDMYGWNFHMGMAAGGNGLMHCFYRVLKAVEAAEKESGPVDGGAKS